MNFNNPTLKQLDSLVRQKEIEPQEYFNRLELAYRTNPTSFTEEEVDYIEKQFKKVDIKFNRDMKAADANLLSTMNQFTSGLVEGFTTLGWAEEPDTTAESIANKLGHLIGFAPDVVASFFSMGRYIPIAAAKRAAITGTSVTRAGLSAAADKAPGFLRKEIGPKTFTLQSIPMKVSDYVVEQSKSYLGSSSLVAGGYLSKGIFANKKFRNIGEQGIHLGVALGVSAWKDGPKGMMDSAMHGAAAGALFGTIGNYVNVGKMLQNPKTRKYAENRIKDVAAEVSKDAAKLEGLNMMIKGTLGSVAQGGMSTAQGLPVPEQVYEYLLGAFFGATARSAGFGDRTKFIMKNDYKNYKLGMTEKEAIEVARKDPDFQALEKSDQQYVETYIAKVVAEKFNAHAPIMSNLQQIPEIDAAIKKLGINPDTITQPEFERVFKQVQQDRSAASLPSADSIKINRPVPAEEPLDTIVKKRSKDSLANEVLSNKIDVELSEMIEMTGQRDLNEPKHVIKNRDLELIAKDIREISGAKQGDIGKGIDEINVTITKIAKENNYDLNKVISGIRKTYSRLPSNYFSEAGGNRNRLGSYLKLKKYFDKKTDYEIDLSGDIIDIREIPGQDINGEVLGGDRPANKYNKTFPGDPLKARLVLRKAFVKSGTTNVGPERTVIDTFKRTSGGPLDYVNPGKKVKNSPTEPIADNFTPVVQAKLEAALNEKGLYIYGGSKDNGTLLLHRYPITDIVGQNFFPKTMRDLFFKDLLTNTGVNIKVRDKKTFSNIYYLMVESGLLDPSLQFTQKASSDRLISAVKQYLKEPLYANLQKFNKYSNLAQGADIPLENVDFTNTLSKQNGQFNMVMVKDFTDPMFNNSPSGTDAAVIARKNVFDIIQTKNFRPANNGFLKLVGYKGPEYGENPVGNILLKTGTFRATTAQDKFMSDNNIDFIVPESAAKTQLGLKLHTLNFDKEWSASESLEPFRMKPDELYLNMGVYENDLKINKPAPFQKQILDKINTAQLGPDLSRTLIDDYQQLSQRSYEGNAVETAKFNQVIADITSGRIKELPKDYSFDVNDISINSINDIISRDLTSPLATETIKKILNRGREDYRELMLETTDEVAGNIMGIEVYEVPDILAKLDYNPGILLQPNVKQFVDKALIRYRTARVVQPLIQNSTTGKLGPRDAETFARHPELNDNTFMLGRDFAKNYNVKLPEQYGGEQTLEQAFTKFKDTKNYTQTARNEIGEALEFMLVRSPNSSNGGVRVLSFAGFVDRKGFSVITTSKNDYYLGGADKDADSVSIYQNMPKSFKESFKKYDNEFQITKDVLYNFEKPSEIFKEFVKEVESISPEVDFANLVNTNERINVAKMARRGKQQMGVIVDAMTRMQNIAEVIQARQGVFETNLHSFEMTPDVAAIRLKDTLPGRKGKLSSTEMAKQLQLDSVNVVNLMADSANFTKIEFYNKIINKVWDTYFTVDSVSGKSNISWGKQSYNVKDKRNYFKDTDHLHSLRLIESVHNDFYKMNGDAIKRIERSDYLAESYLNKLGNDIPFYSNIAKAVRETPDFFVDPYKFYFNEAARKNLEISNIDDLGVVRLHISKLRELIKGDKMFKRFGMQDYWTTHIELDKDLKRLTDAEPYHMHEKLMDYQGIFYSMGKSKEFIREAASTGLGSETAEKIVKNVMDTTYNIKGYWHSEVQLRGIGNMQGERVVTVKDMNNIIMRLKDKYKNAYKPETYEQIETLIDSWLLSRDFRSTSSDLLKRAEEDLAIVNKKIRRQVQRLVELGNNSGESVELARYMKTKAAIYNKLRPTLNFAYKSIAIKESNRKTFFKDQYKMLQEITENITQQIKMPEEKINLKKFLEEEIPFDVAEELPDNYDTSNSRTYDTSEGQIKRPKLSDQQQISADAQERYNKQYPNNINNRFKKDTQTVEDKVQTTNDIMNEILPQFDWLKKKLKPNELVTDEADIEIERTRNIISKNPSSISRFEEFFIDLTFRLEGIGRRLNTLTTQDLKMLNNALEERFSAKSIIDKTTGKIIVKPGWIDQMLNYKKISEKLETFEELEYIKAAVPVIDKFGQQKPRTMNIIVPTSTLEYGRKRIDKFDTLQKLMSSGIEAQHNGYYNFLGIDNANLQRHKDLLVEHAWNVNEYQNGQYPSNERSVEAKKRIKAAYNDSTNAITKLKGIKFPWATEGKSEMIDAFTYAKRLASKFEKDLGQINQSYIKSNHKKIRAYLSKQKVKLDLYKNTKQDRLFEGKSKTEIEKMVDSGEMTGVEATSNMEKMFLNSFGLIRKEIVSLMFKKFDLEAAPDRTIFQDFFSVNDFFFIKYHMQIRDRIEMAYPKIDLDRPLNLKQKEIVESFIKREMGKASYAKHIVGDVYRGYMPRMGHYDVAANIPEIQKFMKKQVERKIKEVSKPGNHKMLPLDLRMAVEYKEMTKQEAIRVYKSTLLARFERNAENNATNGSLESEAQVRDLFTRSNYKGYVGEYTASMFKNRSDAFIPFYKKDLDIIKRYKQQLVKAHLTNLAGFSSELLLRNFDKVNKKEKFAENWSRFMRDAFTNMIGMSNYRALNIHGIEKKDQALYKRYIKNKLSRKKMLLSVADKEKILDFEIAIRVNGAEKENILMRANNNIEVAKKEVNNLRMTRAKKLAQDVNVTGKYGSLYHVTSDESAVKFFGGINKLFGGKLFGDLPSVDPNTGAGEADRRNAVLSRIRGLSDLEGRFELLSLLSHPKTAITNVYGGTVNTIADTGWSAFRKANSTKDVLSMMQSMNAEFTFVDATTGAKKKRGFESRQDIDAWLESLGVYDQMFLDMVSLDRNFGKAGVRKFWEEFISRMNKSYKEGQILTKATSEQIEKKTLREVARDLKVDVPIVEFGALPMKWSERKLRGNAFLANYINMRDNVLGPIKEQVPFDSPVLINYALKGVESSQFMYQATFRPNFANTSLGRVLTRFQPYAWNSVGRRLKLYKGARQSEWNRDVLANKKFQRQFTMDLMSLALANIFIASIFEYALSPPMSWMQDTAALLFGDKKERDRAFFSSYPHPALAPLQIVTPPIGRFVMQPITAILNQDFQTFTDYTLYSYFPYGRLFRDVKRTYNSPAMAPDYLTGLPLHQIHEARRSKIEEQELVDMEADYSLFED